MRLLKDQAVFEMKWPVRHGGTTRNIGTLLMPGVTYGTNTGMLIAADATGLGAAGFLKTQLLAATGDTANTGTYCNWRDVELCHPFYRIEAEYDQADTMAIASMTSTSVVRVTSIENDIDGGWLYCVSGTGAGELHYITTDDATDLTLKSVSTYVAADTLIKIPPLFNRLLKLNATYDKIGTDAAAGSWTARVVANKMKTMPGTWAHLDPTIHDALTGLDDLNVHFFAEIAVLSSLAAVAS
jgi:hypothetical protein